MSEKTKKALDELKRVRDEIRVKLDLASKETRRWWEDLEPQLSQVEDKLLAGGDKVADVSKAVAEEFTAAFRRIRDRVGTDKEEAASDEGEPAEASDADIVDDET